ncbi:MAG: ribosome biogenesis GTP-binding protein YihA/YsxC [Desulfovibrionales bacterium]
MNIQLTLETTAFTRNQIPRVDHPQVAMAGRSNVGKSSLINCLAGQRKLAKTSASPGKTRSLNFYRAQPGDFYLVDLPGYGYARCSKAEREKWGKLVHDYFTSNPWIKGVVVLLDCRLPPQALDLELLAYLQNLGLPITPVLTKVDKCNQKQRARATRIWQDILGRDHAPLTVSARTGQNRERLWELIAATALEKPTPPP